MHSIPVAIRLPPFRRFACAALAVVAGFALGVELWKTLLGSGGSAAGVARQLIGFLTFFTHLANLAVLVAAGRLAWRFDGRFARPRVATAIAAYVAAVCAIYELLLRRLWHPQGLTLVIDTLFHDVVPVVWLTIWWLFIAKGTLRWRDAILWLIAPAAYGLCIGGLGLIAGGSPYPFLNVTSIGGVRVAINIAGLIAGFWVIGLLFVAIDRAGGRPRNG